MYRVELYAEVRRSVYVEGLNERAAARRFGLARETVRKVLRYSAPPGYRRDLPPLNRSRSRVRISGGRRRRDAHEAIQHGTDCQ